MDKATIKSFIRWCDESTDAALLERRNAILQAMQGISSREAKADIRLALRLIDEEVLARLELAVLPSVKAAQ